MQLAGPLRPEATCTRVFLPGCRACGAKHPLAIDPVADPARCLACNSPMPALEDAEISPAVLTGAPAALGRGLMAIGRWLFRLANKG